MKYFTRELLARCQSADDTVARAAELEWEQANERYEEHLRQIDADLPPHIRQFNDLLLHDALVCSIARQHGKLIMVLRKDIPPQDLVILTYQLTEDPVVNPDALSAEQRLKVMDFQLDELDVVNQGGRKVFVQSILFGNGWEMTLHFTDIQVELADALYPVSGILLVPAPTSILQSA